MPTVHTREYEQIFSLFKQPSIGTKVLDANLTKQRSIRTFAPARQEHTDITDRQWYGKGHSHPTFVDTIQKRLVIDAQERSATDLELLYAAAYVMGNVVTTQPDSASKPLQYQHAITWQDLSTNKEVLNTTLMEKFGTEIQHKVVGAYISSFTITGNRDDHVVLSFEGGGREYDETGIFTSPGITTASFFKTLFGTVSFGDADAAADISAQVLSYNITVSQNPQPMHLMGNGLNKERLLSEVLIGDQTANGSVVIKINKDHRDRFTGETVSELVLTLVSPDTVNGDRKTCIINLYNLRISDESWGEEGQTISYTLNFNEDSVMKVGADEHIKLTLLTNIDATELLVDGSV